MSKWKPTDLTHRARRDRLVARAIHYGITLSFLTSLVLWVMARIYPHRTFHIYQVVPWMYTTLVILKVNSLIFNILRDGIEYHKREFLKSPVFSNCKWGELIVKLANFSQFVAMEGYRTNSSSTAGSIYHNHFDSSGSLEMTGIPSSSEDQKEPSREDRSMLTSLVDKTSRLIPSLDIEAIKREHLHNGYELRIEIYETLLEEGIVLDLCQLRLDIFLLQHMIQVYNAVLGIPFSINAVMALVMLIYIIFLTTCYATTYPGKRISCQ